MQKNETERMGRTLPYSEPMSRKELQLFDQLLVDNPTHCNTQRNVLGGRASRTALSLMDENDRLREAAEKVIELTDPDNIRESGESDERTIWEVRKVALQSAALAKAKELNHE